MKKIIIISLFLCSCSSHELEKKVIDAGFIMSSIFKYSDNIYGVWRNSSIDDLSKTLNKVCSPTSTEKICQLDNKGYYLVKSQQTLDLIDITTNQVCPTDVRFYGKTEEVDRITIDCDNTTSWSYNAPDSFGGAMVVYIRNNKSRIDSK